MEIYVKFINETRYHWHLWRTGSEMWMQDSQTRSNINIRSITGHATHDVFVNTCKHLISWWCHGVGTLFYSSFVKRIRRSLMDSPYKGPVMQRIDYLLLALTRMNSRVVAGLKRPCDVTAIYLGRFPFFTTSFKSESMHANLITDFCEYGI